jgi:hypothetical protein
MTKAIIFDLDSCLAAADEVGEPLFAPAFAAIRVVSCLAERGGVRSVSRSRSIELRLVFDTAALQKLQPPARPTMAASRKKG